MAAIGPVLVVLSIPLLLRWVPRNRLYGFRVAATLRDDRVWYEVNARSARHLLALGAVMVLLELVVPKAHRDAILSAVATIGLAATTIVNWRYAKQLARK